MFLLETNVVSELRKAGDGKANANVIDWLSGVEAATLYLSAMTLMEIELGIFRIERRDAAVALRCASLHVPDPRVERDALIAATALVHGMTVATRNVADFEATGVPLLNPWAVR